VEDGSAVDRLLVPQADLDLGAPFDRYRDTIIADWVDANRHLNVAYYMVVFDRATEAFMRNLGAGRAYTDSGTGTVFALEANIRYERELHLNDPVGISTRLLDHNGKLLHLLHAMRHQETGLRAARMELLLLHVDPRTRRGSPWPSDILARIEAVRATHRALAAPGDAELKIRIRR
jgi:acyl-CoA thioester hydrolase